MVLVTGAARGLGQGIARELARDGDRIAFTYRNGGTPPDETLALVRPHDPDVVAVPSALDDEASAQALIDAVVAARGPIEVLVHAIGPIVVKRFARCTLDDYRAMIDGNLGSAVALAFAALPGMRERRYGRIVYFGMNGSSVTQPALGMALYGADGAVLDGEARRWEEGRFGLDQLLAYSAVCGTGLDTIPLPGDCSSEDLVNIICDVASLALRQRKPLSARLLPVPGKVAGERTSFSSPYLVNTVIKPLRPGP